MTQTNNPNGSCSDKECACERDTDMRPEFTVIGPVNDQPCCGSPPGDPSGPDEIPGYVLWHFVDDFINTSAGKVPRVKTSISTSDLLGTFGARTGINRNNYRIAPGLYCTGDPTHDSPVFVSANYKLSFDNLRKGLDGISSWVIVLDTRGINVWCAAGKGTFSTDEIISKVKQTGLEKIVNHRELILPQLSATGVSAKKVKKGCGFKVIWGPVRSKDLKQFIRNGNRADNFMRRATFSLKERLVLVPIELSITIKLFLWSLLVMFILSGIGADIFSFGFALNRGITGVIALVAGLVAGTVAVPALLPWIPGVAFSLKGAFTGLIAGIGVVLFKGEGLSTMEIPALILLTAAVSSYLAMNFTGSTPFTSPSGVEKEMRRAIPLQISSVLVASVLWVWGSFV